MISIGNSLLLTVPKRKGHATPQRVGEGAWGSKRVSQNTEGVRTLGTTMISPEKNEAWQGELV